jgi:hypothetical protein
MTTMLVYKFVWPTGYSAHMTVPQYDTACEIAHRYNLPHEVTVSPVFLGDGAVAITVDGMYIAILPDGSSHT